MKYAILTLGCKANQYDTQAIETLLRERGFAPAAESDADVIIVNTCAVTAESGRKSRQAARRLRGLHPHALLAICGCYSQLEPEESAALGADVIFGSGDRAQFVEAIAARLVGRGAPGAPPVTDDAGDRGYCTGGRERSPLQNPVSVVSVPDLTGGQKFEELPAGSVAGRTRAMLKIQDGCDNFCTYCVIPAVRDRARSLPLTRAAEMAAELQARGFRELVLTGIEIASYGKDFMESQSPGAMRHLLSKGGYENGIGLIDCVEAVARAAPGLRLRLGSLEPTVVTGDFCRRLRALGSVCGHFHLSLQSGCDTTLRAMGRKYDTARFAEAARLLRAYFPDCALGADLIVGFPGETEDDFQRTLTFLEQCAFAFLHVFPYSIRPGTQAAALPGQSDRAEKARRAKLARALGLRTKNDYLRSCADKTLSVLFEAEKNGRCAGHAENYCEVSVAAPEMGESLRGSVREVKIEGVSGGALVGRIM